MGHLSSIWYACGFDSIKYVCVSAHMCSSSFSNPLYPSLFALLSNLLLLPNSD